MLLFGNVSTFLFRKFIIPKIYGSLISETKLTFAVTMEDLTCLMVKVRTPNEVRLQNIRKSRKLRDDFLQCNGLTVLFGCLNTG